MKMKFLAIIISALIFSNFAMHAKPSLAKIVKTSWNVTKILGGGGMTLVALPTLVGSSGFLALILAGSFIHDGTFTSTTEDERSLIVLCTTGIIAGLPGTYFGYKLIKSGLDGFKKIDIDKKKKKNITQS